MCCMQVVPDPATERLSFAYKLCCPRDAVLSQYNNLSADNKQVDQKYAFLQICEMLACLKLSKP